MGKPEGKEKEAKVERGRQMSTLVRKKEENIGITKRRKMDEEEKSEGVLKRRRERKKARDGEKKRRIKGRKEIL